MTEAYAYEIEQVKQILKEAESVVFFGGAGVSTDSGIPDFRGAGGLYTGAGESNAYYLSRECLAGDPEKFFEFFRSNMLFPYAEPNEAHIALARFDEKTADGIMEELVEAHADDSICLFEAAQYYAAKCDYDKAIELYERSFAAEKRRPRFQDELMGIADVYRIRGDFRMAAQTYDRIIELLQSEWGMTEEVALQEARQKKAQLLARA